MKVRQAFEPGLNNACQWKCAQLPPIDDSLLTTLSHDQAIFNDGRESSDHFIAYPEDSENLADPS
jgi:hypothetical protein